MVNGKRLLTHITKTYLFLLFCLGMDLHTHFILFLHLFVSINFILFVHFFICDNHTHTHTKASFDHTLQRKLFQKKKHASKKITEMFFISHILCVSKTKNSDLSTHITHIHTYTKQHWFRGFCSLNDLVFFYLVNLILLFFLHWTKLSY